MKVIVLFSLIVSFAHISRVLPGKRKAAEVFTEEQSNKESCVEQEQQFLSPEQVIKFLVNAGVHSDESSLAIDQALNCIPIFPQQLQVLIDAAQAAQSEGGFEVAAHGLYRLSLRQDLEYDYRIAALCQGAWYAPPTLQEEFAIAMHKLSFEPNLSHGEIINIFNRGASWASPSLRDTLFVPSLYSLSQQPNISFNQMLEALIILTKCASDHVYAQLMDSILCQITAYPNMHLLEKLSMLANSAAILINISPAVYVRLHYPATLHLKNAIHMRIKYP